MSDGKAEEVKPNPPTYVSIIDEFDVALPKRSFWFRVQQDVPIGNWDGVDPLDIALKKRQFKHAKCILETECDVPVDPGLSRVFATALYERSSTQEKQRGEPEGRDGGGYPDPDSITLNDYNAAYPASSEGTRPPPMAFRVQMDLPIQTKELADQLSQMLFGGEVELVWQLLKSKCGVSDNGGKGNDLILAALNLVEGADGQVRARRPRIQVPR